MIFSKGATLLCLVTAWCVLAASYNIEQASSLPCETKLASVRIEMTPRMLHVICHDNSSITLGIKIDNNDWYERLLGFCDTFDNNTWEASVDQLLDSTSMFLHLVQSGRLLDSARVEIISHHLSNYRVSVGGNHNTRFILEITRECSKNPHYDFIVTENDTQQTYLDQASQKLPLIHIGNRTSALIFHPTTSNEQSNFIRDRFPGIPEHVRPNNLSRNVVNSNGKIKSENIFQETWRSQIDEKVSIRRGAIAQVKVHRPTLFRLSKGQNRNVHAQTSAEGLETLYYILKHAKKFNVYPITNMSVMRSVYRYPKPASDQTLSSEHLSLPPDVKSPPRIYYQAELFNKRHEQLKNQQSNGSRIYFEHNEINLELLPSIKSSAQSELLTSSKSSVQSELVQSEPSIWTALFANSSYLGHPSRTRKKRAENGDVVLGNETLELSYSGTVDSSVVSDLSVPLLLESLSITQTLQLPLQYPTTIIEDYTIPTNFSDLLMQEYTSQTVSDTQSESTVYRSGASDLQDLHSLTDIVDRVVTHDITLLAPSATLATEISTFDFGITVYLHNSRDGNDISRSPITSLLALSSSTSTNMFLSMSANDWVQPQITNGLYYSIQGSRNPEQVESTISSSFFLYTPVLQSNNVQETFSPVYDDVTTPSQSHIASSIGSHDSVILTRDLFLSSVLSPVFSSLPFNLASSSAEVNSNPTSQTFAGVNSIPTSQPFSESRFSDSLLMSSDYWNTLVQEINHNQDTPLAVYDSSIILQTSLVTPSGNDDTMILTRSPLISSFSLLLFPSSSFSFESSATQQGAGVNLFTTTDVHTADSMQLSTTPSTYSIVSSYSPTQSSTPTNHQSSTKSINIVTSVQSSTKKIDTVTSVQSFTKSINTVTNVQSSTEDIHTVASVHASTKSILTSIQTPSTMSAHTIAIVKSSMTTITQTVISSQSSTITDLPQTSQPTVVTSTSSIPWDSGTSQANIDDQEGLESDSFWPVVAGLVIGIPAIIVLGIAITVIHRKSRRDPSKFFNMKTLNNSSLSSLATARQDISQQSSVDV